MPPMSDTQREGRLMRGGVMSRLFAAPYRWKLREIAEVWGMTKMGVSHLIRFARYGAKT